MAALAKAKPGATAVWPSAAATSVLVTRPAHTLRPARRCASSRSACFQPPAPMPAPAVLCTTTSWPCATSSRTDDGVSPTRYSWFLISLGTPTFIVGPPRSRGSAPRAP
jgi:hypothetical protein